jgi:4-diphosphocytidyl-2-C-methyl-D-erythritol kinase
LKSIIQLCPAKVNEFLTIGRRDGRGYHPLRTTFQAIALYDELEVQISEQDSFEADMALPERNTVTRAWTLMREYTHLPPLSTKLRKRIPAEAGLGGGSSDAAGFLKAANRLALHPVKAGDLREIALAIGADVPFFLDGPRARGEGYGEILISLPPLPETWVVLAKPSIGCPTAEMYERLDQIEEPFREWEDLLLYNAFERVAPSACLALLDWLRRKGLRAGLSGSGSAVFSFASSENEAERIREEVPSELASWTAVAPTLAEAL